jgi:soluble lytic murein transglycosylase
MLSRYRETIRVWSDPVGRVLFRLHLRPNHLTLAGLGVSLLAAAGFVTGRTRLAGLLLLLAGLFDFFDGSLARASRQVTPFGAFLDSVIDRYSDLVVLLGIVVLFARMPHTRGAIVAMAGLVGSVMVSYTRARAESLGVECHVGMMERPERLICLIAGSLLDLLEPALWVLAVLSNLTAVQRIAFTWRAAREQAMLPVAVAALLLVTPAAAAETPGAVAPETERAWRRAVEEFQAGDPRLLARQFAAPAALGSPIGDYARFLLADALARLGDLGEARQAALGVAEHHPASPLAPPALLMAATLAARAGDEVAAQAALTRLIGSYPDTPLVPEALYLLGMTGEARGQAEAAALAYRELTILAPASGWADGAADRLQALAAAGVRVPALSLTQRIDRAERLLRGGVAKTASDEAAEIAREAREPGLVVRALRVVAAASQRLGRYDVAAQALEMAAARVPADRRPALQLEQGRLLVRAGQEERALGVLGAVESHGTAAEASEAGYLRARTLEDLNRTSQAAAAYRAVAARYPAREVAGAALWRLGWLAWGRGDVKAAGRTWSRLLDLPGGRAFRLPALYWTGRAREASGSREAAADLYRRVVADAPRSYYGVLAVRRLADAPARVADAEAAASPAAVQPVLRLPADPREALADDPGFVRVDLLRRIGLVEFALSELERVVAHSVGDPVRLYGASGAYVRDERYHLALRILRRHFTDYAVAGSQALPRAFWEMLYPFGWRKEVVEAAERTGLDPFFVAAVVREESSYHPRALSRAGARGLMQLLPATAQPMAELRGLAFRDGDLLDEPRVNLELGAAFLAGLLREFGDPRLALAAYNAGPKRVREWWKARRTGDVEAFVEMIPYDETRQYVKRVMLSWEEYRRIYGGR